MKLQHRDETMTQEEVRAIVDVWARRDPSGSPRVSDIAEALGASEDEVRQALTAVRRGRVAVGKRRISLPALALTWSNIIFALAMVLFGPKKHYFEWKYSKFGDYYLQGCEWDTVVLYVCLFTVVSVDGYFLGKKLLSVKAEQAASSSPEPE